MNTGRNTARAVGTLFIIGTIAGILSAVFTGSIFEGPDYLEKIADSRTQLAFGTICVLVMGFALALVPLVLYPIFRKFNETLALGYVVFRGGLETATYILVAVSWLLLLVVNREYTGGAGDPAALQTLGALLRGAGDQINHVTEIVFSLGALMFYTLWYRSKLIPRWLSGWGWIGALAYLAAGLGALFGADLGTLIFPLAVQEMFQALWLIIRGFNPEAFRVLPAGGRVADSALPA
jgi:Domain of unknown function (DUF4386)